MKLPQGLEMFPRLNWFYEEILAPFGYALAVLGVVGLIFMFALGFMYLTDHHGKVIFWICAILALYGIGRGLRGAL